ncbi:MAG: OmpA family protein, partial [Saprospiraceae bacterium]
VEGKYTLQETLLFDFGKAELRPGSAPAIEKLAQTLLRNPSLRFEIGGHTDAVGDEASNQSLSEQRAQSLYNALLEKKVPAIQLQ